MKGLKDQLDPGGLLNPGKIVGSAEAPVAVLDQNLRYGPSYLAQGWLPVLDFSHQAGLGGAIEQCNGAAVCRKEDGVMCPSYQATRDEMHSTRGRANLLRAMISGQIEDPRQAEELVHEALDLCLACKGCKAECPSSVDVAKLRYEFSQYYYSSRAAERHNRPLRDYLFGYIGALGRMAHPFAPVASPLMSSRAGKQALAKLFRLDSRRAFPRFSSRSLRGLYVPSSQKDPPETVLFLSDPFTEYFQPEVGLAALRALERAGCRMILLPTIGSGRTLISKGFLEKAKMHARKLVDQVAALDPQGKLLLVGVEPSEVYSLLDEYLDFFPDNPRVKYLAEHSFLVDEFLLRPGPDGETRLKRLLAADHGRAERSRGTAREPVKMRVLLHGHCYQKAQAPAADGYPVGVAASREMLESCGYQVQVIEAGCCGMAGAFGYEAEHYDLSMKVGELALFPAIRKASEMYGEDFRVAAAGVSCQGQIQDGAGKKALHPIQLVYEIIEATEA
jgi:Fe-S oxidoreductase